VAISSYDMILQKILNMNHLRSGCITSTSTVAGLDDLPSKIASLLFILINF